MRHFQTHLLPGGFLLLCSVAPAQDSLTVEGNASRALAPGNGQATSASPIAPEDWQAQVSQELARMEYHFSHVDDSTAPASGAWSAPNRSQELRSRVSTAGIEVFPRAIAASGEGSGWKLHLRTASFGRQGAAAPVAALEMQRSENRIELRCGPLEEWFVNAERGIEQGWTIGTPPAGRGPLEIGLALGGELALRLDDGRCSGVFVDGRGEVRLAYGKLRAWDAAGRELESWLALAQGGLAIQVDDARASYPITVDPLLTNPWTAESNQAGAVFGFSVSRAGDVNGDGYADVIVGAPSYDNGEVDEGRAFVYLGSADGLAAGAAWIAESDQEDAVFGFSVSTAGDVNGDGYSDVIVGAEWYDNGESGEGRAFVYLGSAGGLAAGAAWIAESNQVNALFGDSVSTAGDVNGDGYADVIVGARWYDNGQSDEGRAFVYLGSAGGLEAGAAWIAESNQQSAYFGSSVSTAGDVNGDGYSDVIVGAGGYDTGELDAGRAFVYLGSAGGLAASAAWTAESNQRSAYFGHPVSTAGDVNGDGYSDVIVGALAYNNGEEDEGRAFVYLGSAGGLAASAAWAAESNQVNAVFGNSVSAAGDVNGDGYSDVIVGAQWYDHGENLEGRAFVYHGSAGGLAASAAWAWESNQGDAYFGFSVSTAGDVNGDGYSDVIVGARDYDNGETNEGRAFVYHGSSSGLAVFVDCAHVGPESGTFAQPFDSLAEGISAVSPGGTLVILSASCDDAPMAISKALTLQTLYGPATIQ